FGGSAATAYNIFIVYLFFCLAFALVIGIGLLAYVYGSTALRTKIGGAAVGVLLFILLSPILIWFVIAKAFELNKEHKSAMENPELYEEEQRLKKNSELMNYLIRTTKKDGETNQLRMQDAIRYLHRIPSTNESNFLVGITKDREAVLLFPRPFGTVIYGTVHRFIGVPLTFETFVPAKHDPYGVNLNNNPEKYYIKHKNELMQWTVYDIETFLYPKKVYDLKRFLDTFNESDIYKEYVHTACTHYSLNKDKVFDLNKDEKAVVDNVLSLDEYRRKKLSEQ